MAEILATRPAIAWLEIVADEHLSMGGQMFDDLESIASLYPLTLHCAGMSLAAVEPLDKDYCRQIQRLAKRVNAVWISEHLSFSSMNGHFSHNLLPIPYHEESLLHCVDRIHQIQDFFGERILLENIASYMAFLASDRAEIDFLIELVERADCWLLLDINNLYVNQMNLGVNALEYISKLPKERIKEIHLAGYSEQGGLLIDSHNRPVAEPVWELYQRLIDHCPGVPTLIEWDIDVPPLHVLLEQATKAEVINHEVLVA